MARIKGVDIPNDKQVGVSLTYIYGIGNTTSKKVLEAVKIDATRKVKDLSNEELDKIRDEISNYVVEIYIYEDYVILLWWADTLDEP